MNKHKHILVTLYISYKVAMSGATEQWLTTEPNRHG